jgi:hypothetical protein
MFFVLRPKPSLLWFLSYPYLQGIMQQEQAGTSAALEVDLTQYPNAQKLLQRCQDFFIEVENL